MSNESHVEKFPTPPSKPQRMMYRVGKPPVIITEDSILQPSPDDRPTWRTSNRRMPLKGLFAAARWLISKVTFRMKKFPDA
jgi:hypothetical protein